MILILPGRAKERYETNYNNDETIAGFGTTL